MFYPYGYGYYGYGAVSYTHLDVYKRQTVGTLESGTVRLSFSAMNTPAEVCRFLAILRKLSRG